MVLCKWTVLVVLIAACADAVQSVSYESTASTSTAMSITQSSLTQFWADYSFLGLEVECVDPWKDCLAIGRILDESSGGCYPIGDRRPCGGNGSFVLDRGALEAGRLQAVCRRDDCSGGFTMAYDGECYNASYIQEALCNSSAALVRHPLGGWECLCLRSECGDNAAGVRQPVEPGRCSLPAFAPQVQERYAVRCSVLVVRCLQLGELPFEGECHPPLSAAACPAGEWLTLSAGAAAAGALRAECAAVRPCGAGALRLRADGRCHPDEEVRATLCPGDALWNAPTGDVLCSADLAQSGASVRVITECDMRNNKINLFENGTYFIDHDMLYVYTVIESAPIDCPQGNTGTCAPKVDPNDPHPDVGR